MSKKNVKIGRPTSSPKTDMLTVRVSDEVKEILVNYCKEHNISLSDGVRRAIQQLK